MAEGDRVRRRRRRRLAGWAATGVAPFAVVAAGVALQAASGWPSRLGIALLVAAASLVSGGLVGFLFGIPRSLQGEHANDSARPATFRVNTNLEQISDWLTKILVGVGLIQLGVLLEKGGQVARSVGEAFGAGPGARVVAAALLLFSTVTGFLIGYVVTRTRLTLVFAQFDRGEVESLVDRRMRERFQPDGDAMQLVLQQMEENEPPVDAARLRDALTDASPAGRAQVLVLAQEQRRKSWRSPATRGTLDRLVPIFQALVSADGNRHRYWGNLGFTLKDKEPPDYRGAVESLDRAIERRGTQPGHGKETYEFVRALTRVHLLDGRPPDPETELAIRQDVRVAFQDAQLRKRVLDAVRATSDRTAPDRTAPDRTAPDRTAAADQELALLRPFLPD